MSSTILISGNLSAIFSYINTAEINFVENLSNGFAPVGDNNVGEGSDVQVWAPYVNGRGSALISIQYSDVTMSIMASQITGISSVCPTVCSGAHQRKHRSSVWGESTGDWWFPLTKGQYHGKCFHLMTSSCHWFIVLGHVVITLKVLFPNTD